MNKKLKIFITIIYYIFTIGIGILIAIVSPGIIMTRELPKHLEEYLNNREYARCVNLLAGYDDKEIAYQETFQDGSGIVLFRTLSIVQNVGEDKTQDDNVYNSYSGFIYNLGGNYKAFSVVNNHTALVVNYDKLTYKAGKGSGDGLVSNTEINLLNHDTDGDGMYDTIVTLLNFNYVYFEITEKRVSSIENITFLDNEGKVYITVNKHLDFTNEFHTSLNEFVTTYNNDSKDSKLVDLEKAFLAKNANYEKCSYQEETKLAQSSGAIVVLVYFIIIYILGDVLLWPRFIPAVCYWAYKKIRRKMGKEESDMAEQVSVYGSDYYTQLTVNLKVPEDCGINITVHYHNETDEINMIFNKENNYSVTQRTHAGVYVNAWLEAPGYESENLPSSLAVRGYKMNVDVSLRKALNENNLVEESENKKEE